MSQLIRHIAGNYNTETGKQECILCGKVLCDNTVMEGLFGKFRPSTHWPVGPLYQNRSGIQIIVTEEEDDNSIDCTE